MITVVIPTLNSEAYIADMLMSLMPAVMNGLITEVVVSDGGSDDHTYKICDEMGAHYIKGEAGRGKQLAAGGSVAKGTWLLFLHVDTHLEPGWLEAIAIFTQQAHASPKAAYFKFGLNDKGMMPYIIEKSVALRCKVMGLPYGDQGLLISKKHYEAIGGYAALPLMEDVNIIQKIGAKNLAMLSATVKTSPERYKKEGYIKRIGRNFVCISLYFIGVKPKVIDRIYRGGLK